MAPFAPALLLEKPAARMPQGRVRSLDANLGSWLTVGPHNDIERLPAFVKARAHPLPGAKRRELEAEAPKRTSNEGTLPSYRPRSSAL